MRDREQLAFISFEKILGKHTDLGEGREYEFHEFAHRNVFSEGHKVAFQIYGFREFSV